MFPRIRIAISFMDLELIMMIRTASCNVTLGFVGRRTTHKNIGTVEKGQQRDRDRVSCCRNFLMHMANFMVSARHRELRTGLAAAMEEQNTHGFVLARNPKITCKNAVQQQPEFRKSFFSKFSFCSRPICSGRGTRRRRKEVWEQSF